jgi:DNA-binding transcriptional ArsR family regulator
MRRDVFQGIADPTRRAILIRLTAGALTPNALAERFEISRQAVSRHIRILCECELVSQRQLGREIYYEVKPEALKEADTWINEFRALWESRFGQLDTLLTTITPQDHD